MFMKYSIALTLVKGLSPKMLNQVYALDQNEKELFEKITQNYSCNANKTLDRASQIIEDCLENNIQIINQKDKYYPKLLLIVLTDLMLFIKKVLNTSITYLVLV